MSASRFAAALGVAVLATAQILNQQEKEATRLDFDPAYLQLKSRLSAFEHEARSKVSRAEGWRARSAQSDYDFFIAPKIAEVGGMLNDFLITGNRFHLQQANGLLSLAMQHASMLS